MPAEAGDEDDGHEPVSGDDAIKLADYPLAMPYVLTPACITLLTVFSGALGSWLMLGIIVVLVLLVAALALLFFRNLDRNSGFSDRSRLVVTETVLGVLLAALAVELVLRGLVEFGILDIVMH